jgi:hypothetical protein
MQVNMWPKKAINKHLTIARFTIKRWTFRQATTIALQANKLIRQNGKFPTSCLASITPRCWWRVY